MKHSHLNLKFLKMQELTFFLAININAKLYKTNLESLYSELILKSMIETQQN